MSIKGLLWMPHASKQLFIIIMAVCICICVSDFVVAKENIKALKKYPEVWRRDFPEHEKVVLVFKSKKNGFFNDPVVIIKNIKTNRYFSLNFFSGNRREVYKIRMKDACTPLFLDEYYDKNFSRQIVRDYLPQEKPCSYEAIFEDGSEISLGGDQLFQFGVVDDEELIPAHIKSGFRNNFSGNTQIIDSDYKLRIINGEVKYAAIGEHEGTCEPAKEYIKMRKGGRLIWAKSFITFYSDKSKSPKQDNIKCLSEKIRVDSKILNFTILNDKTLLVATPSSVIRISRIDGSAKKSEIHPQVINTAALVKIKLEMMHEQAEAERECVIMKKDMKGSHGCGLYRSSPSDLEQVQVDLAKRLFDF